MSFGNVFDAAPVMILPPFCLFLPQVVMMWLDSSWGK
jgi:hypothetical protein